MHKFIFLFSIYLLFLTPVAQAAKYNSPDCKNLDHLDSFLIEKGVHCETLKKFENIFNSVQLKTRSSIPFPRVFISAKSYESWSTYGNLVFINQEQISWGEVKSEDQHDMVWIHEIGHLIFQEKLQKDFSNLECFHNYMIQDANDKWKAQTPSIIQNHASNWKPACQKARDLQTNYSELFADYIVAVVMDDIKAPLKYMQSKSAPKEEQEKIKLYDFDSQHLLSACVDKDPHFFFSPARSIIGKNLFAVSANKADSINKLYMTLKDDLLSYDRGNVTLHDCVSANKQLISKMIN